MADSLLNFNTYQQESRSTAIYPEIRGSEVYPVLGLVNEAGEVAGKVKKIYRDGDGEYKVSDLDALKGELGDVLWYLSQIATELGLSLSDIAETNLEKLRSRQERGVLGGSGDKR